MSETEKERVSDTDRQTDGQRTQNSELYYTRIEILSICLFVQSFLANLHVNTYKTAVRTLTTMMIMTLVTMMTY